MIHVVFDRIQSPGEAVETIIRAFHELAEAFEFKLNNFQIWERLLIGLYKRISSEVISWFETLESSADGQDQCANKISYGWNTREKY